MKRIVRLLLAAATTMSALAQAATFSVTEDADIVDAIPGDGICNIFPQVSPALCTLRAAVIEANALAGADSILLQANQTYRLTRVGADEFFAATGDLDLRDSVSILFLGSETQRPVIDANGLERAFHVISGNITMIGFDIIGGNEPAWNEDTFGGGAIYITAWAGAVQLSLLRIHDNLAEAGGALFNDGDNTTVSACEFYDNQVTPPFVVSGGAAIFNRGDLVVEYSSVWHQITETGSPATAIVNFTTDGRALTVRNTTIAENRIGINNQQDSPLIVVNATIVGNSQFGIAVIGDGLLQMRNTVVAKNDSADCSISETATLNLNRYNMDSDNTCELSDGTSNYPGVEPYLTPIKRHSGVNMASWPLTISPMIDQGHPVIGNIGCEEDDQHFQDRPVDFDGNGNARCDVGSMEMSDDVIFFYPFDLY